MANNAPFIHAPSSGAPRQFLPLRGTPIDNESAMLQTQMAGVSQAGEAIRLRSFDNASDAVPVEGFQTILGSVSFSMLYNGSDTWDRMREASAVNLATTVASGAALTAEPGQWAIRSQPAAATQATVSRAAVASTRHVCKSITLSLLGVAAQGPIEFFLRDGATGAGAVLWSIRLQCPAGDVRTIVLSGVNIVGSVNTAMTLESGAAPAATNFASVALTGYDAT